MAGDRVSYIHWEHVSAAKAMSSLGKSVKAKGTDHPCVVLEQTSSRDTSELTPLTLALVLVFPSSGVPGLFQRCTHPTKKPCHQVAPGCGARGAQ